MCAITRRDLVASVGALSMGARISGAPDSANRPNIILLMTDDQGYGDLGCHGNPAIHTPNLDKLYGESIRFTNFHVSPLCSPTRASLMTGRYNYRTGVVDTWVGQALMRPTEITAGQIFSEAGYRTGLFGKWHLGDNYPLRPHERGFEETLIHHDGAIGSVPDPPYNRYQDPVLFRNGIAQPQKGYCTDIFFDAAMRFIEETRNQPFFIYLPVNVPHVPLQISETYVEPYRRAGLVEETARVYGMLTNFDENVGRLSDFLAKHNLRTNTILIYMSDNGPIGKERFNAGLRGGKGTLHEGGTKVPFFVRWPDKLKTGVDIDRIAAHIDVLPTLIDLARIRPPREIAFDGRSLRSLLEGRIVDWPDRNLFFQQSRPDRNGIDEPRLFTNCAIRSQRYRLVMSAGAGKDVYATPVLANESQLFDIEKDPSERHDISSTRPEIVKQLRADYEAWFHDVTRGLSPVVRIVIGSSRENPLTLTTQDLRGPKAFQAPWHYDQLGALLRTEPAGQGWWEVFIEDHGSYEFTLRLGPLDRDDTPPLKAGRAFLTVAGQQWEAPIESNGKSVSFRPQLRQGPARIVAELSGQRRDGRKATAFFVDVRRSG